MLRTLSDPQAASYAFMYGGIVSPPGVGRSGRSLRMRPRQQDVNDVAPTHYPRRATAAAIFCSWFSMTEAMVRFRPAAFASRNALSARMKKPICDS